MDHKVDIVFPAVTVVADKQEPVCPGMVRSTLCAFVKSFDVTMQELEDRREEVGELRCIMEKLHADNRHLRRVVAELAAQTDNDKKEREIMELQRVLAEVYEGIEISNEESAKRFQEKDEEIQAKDEEIQVRDEEIQRLRDLLEITRGTLLTVSTQQSDSSRILQETLEHNTIEAARFAQQLHDRDAVIANLEQRVVHLLQERDDVYQELSHTREELARVTVEVDCVGGVIMREDELEEELGEKQQELHHAHHELAMSKEIAKAQAAQIAHLQKELANKNAIIAVLQG